MQNYIKKKLTVRSVTVNTSQLHIKKQHSDWFIMCSGLDVNDNIYKNKLFKNIYVLERWGPIAPSF